MLLLLESWFIYSTHNWMQLVSYQPQLICYRCATKLAINFKVTIIKTGDYGVWMNLCALQHGKAERRMRFLGFIFV